MYNINSTKGLIAIVDDDLSVRTALDNLLSSVDYKVILFESAEALLHCDILSIISFMVLDVKLNGMNGIELYEHLRANKINIPTAFMSGNADLITQLRIAHLGALVFLPKPIDVEIFLRRIDDALKK